MTKADQARAKRLTMISIQIKGVDERIGELLTNLSVLYQKIAELNGKDDEESNYIRGALVALIIKSRAEKIEPLLKERQVLIEELQSVFTKTRFKGRDAIKKEFGV